MPGALLPAAIYDPLISPADVDVVLAGTGRDGRVPAPNGIYRSTDGAGSWRRVHHLAGSGGRFGRGSATVAPDDRSLMFAGGQFAVGTSTNGGQTWTEQQPQGTSAQACTTS